MKQKIHIILGAFVSLLISMTFTFPSAAAEQSQTSGFDRARLVVESYEITSGDVLPGSKIEIKLTVKNISGKHDAKDAVLSVANNQGIVLPVEECSNQIVIGTVKADSTCEVVLPLRVCEEVGNVENITLSFYFSFLDVTASEITNEAYISFPLNRECKPVIVQLSLSDNCYVSENSVLSTAVENVGSVAAQNVSLHLVVSGAEELVYDLGSISGGVTKLYDHTINMPQAGEQVIEAYLTYEDETGVQLSSEKSDYNVRVLDSSSSLLELQNNSKKGLNIFTIVGNILLVSVAVGIIVVYHKRDMTRITSGKEVGYGKRS